MLELFIPFKIVHIQPLFIAQGSYFRLWNPFPFILYDLWLLGLTKLLGAARQPTALHYCCAR